MMTATFTFAVSLAISGLAQAETLAVGPDQPYKMPSQAAQVAKDGDTIEITPGEYFDCAVWRANNLTIVGTGPDVVITDKTCAGKGIFVITGNNITVSNLTLTRARVPDGNGAGIRSEGVNLKVTKTRFINNQDGILATPITENTSTMDIADSEFIRNGSCENALGCGSAIYANRLALLRIVRSKFFETQDAHHIKSRAARTEVLNNEISDGPRGTSSYLIDLPNGGGLLAEGNVLEKGPNCSNHSAAIVIGAEGVNQRTPELIIKDNTFTNDYAGETAFVRNITATEAQLSGNTLSGQVIPLIGDGKVR